MKRFFLMAAMVAFGFSVNAQNFSAGINLGLPVGDAGDVSSFSVGLDVAYLWEVSEEFDAGIASGYIHGFGKEEEVGGMTFSYDDAQFVPIAGAARYNVSEEFYVGADLGYALGINEGNDGGFYYRPKVGYGFSEKVGANLSYSGVSMDGFTWSTINAGVEFKF